MIDVGLGKSRGFLCNAIYLVGDGKVRIIFTTTLEELATFYRDYDFYTDTVSERVEVLLKTDNGNIRLNCDTYKSYLESKGFAQPATSYPHPIVNKVSEYNGELYTLKEGGNPEKVSIRIVTDQVERQIQEKVYNNGAPLL